jgi:hypothetical protein
VKVEGEGPKTWPKGTTHDMWKLRVSPLSSLSSEYPRGGVTEGAAVVEMRGEVEGPILGRELVLGSRGEVVAEVGCDP